MADSRPGPTFDLVRYLLAWVPAGVAALYLKSHILTTQGYRLVAQEMGPAPVTGWARLVLFRADLALALVVVPAVLLVILRFCPSMLRPAIVASVGVLVLVIVFVQLKSFDAAGGFVSLFFIRQGLSWSYEQPEFTAQYVARTELIGLVATCLLTIAGAAWAFWRQRSRPVRGSTGRLRGWLAGGVLVGVTLLSWSIPIGPTSYQGSALAAAGRTLLVWGRPVDPIDQDLSASPPPRPEDLTGVAPHGGDAAYVGLARGSDVVYFILETAPARVLPIDGSLEDLPNLKRLREHAFVLPRHYSTYPYTSFALFSILCSAYPSDRLGPLARPFDGGPIPGTMATLAGIGYRTALYAPNPQRFGGDSVMYAALGITEQHAPPSGVGTPEAGAPPWRRTLARDSAAFDLLLKDVDRWIGQDQRYAAVFLPQIGYAPWPDLSPDRSQATPAERARRVIELQDQWIGELMALLDRRGRLRRTIIVVVGDHGIRTTKEAGDFSGGTIDDYSFHVPGLIYAPQLEAPRRIEVLTSHIDIGPTVLDLLGATAGRALEQGSPVWAEGLQDRTTFFLSRYYLGADGYYRRGNVFMWNYLAGAAFFSHYPLAFPDSTVLPAESPASRHVESTLRHASLERERVLHDLETGGGESPVSPQ